MISDKSYPHYDNHEGMDILVISICPRDGWCSLIISTNLHYLSVEVDDQYLLNGGQDNLLNLHVPKYATILVAGPNAHY